MRDLPHCLAVPCLSASGNLLYAAVSACCTSASYNSQRQQVLHSGSLLASASLSSAVTALDKSTLEATCLTTVRFAQAHW